MNPGLVWRSLRESLGGTLLFGLGILVFQLVMTTVLPSFVDQMAGPLLRIPFLQNIFRALLGADIGDGIGPDAVTAIGWVHPVLLALFWGHAITFGTRVPAAEVDRGTIDLLLGLPISRWQLYRSETATCLLSGAALVAFSWTGHVLGRTIAGAESALPFVQIAAIATNLLAMYVAVAGLAFLVSALSERRMPAMGWLFAIVLGSLCWQFLGQFWQPAKTLSFLGILDYYRPFEIVTTGRWPHADVAVLVGLGAGLWFTGGVVFARRDLRAL